MRRLVLVLLLGSIAFVALIAQSAKGWMLRADRSTSASDPDAPGGIKFVAMGSGFHATNPQAAVYWNPANTATGNYSLTGTFTLVKPSNHTNYYGLVFGGSDLEGAAQRYLYFLVAQDGTWLVKRRDGDAATETLLPKTASDAVRKPDASGQSTNALEVRVTGTAIAFVVNGTVVNTWLGAGRAVKTDGVYGIRVNHFLEVQVDGFASTGGAALDAPSGETVAMTSTVDRILSSTAFSLDRDKTTSAGEGVLVLAPTLRAPVDLHAPVTVFGEMVTFDAAAIARKTKDTVDLPADVAAKYRGRPAVVATTVLNAKMVDLTKPLPPPITADEEALSKVMKRVAPAFAALGQAADGSNAEAARQNAIILKQAFTEIEAFWTAKARQDAMKWAQDARLQAEAIERDAATGAWDRVKTSAGTLGKQCQACHATYREQFADGSFRIKMGAR